MNTRALAGGLLVLAVGFLLLLYLWRDTGPLPLANAAAAGSAERGGSPSPSSASQAPPSVDGAARQPLPVTGDGEADRAGGAAAAANATTVLHGLLLDAGGAPVPDCLYARLPDAVPPENFGSDTPDRDKEAAADHPRTGKNGQWTVRSPAGEPLRIAFWPYWHLRIVYALDHSLPKGGEPLRLEFPELGAVSVSLQASQDTLWSPTVEPVAPRPHGPEQYDPITLTQKGRYGTVWMRVWLGSTFDLVSSNTHYDFIGPIGLPVLVRNYTPAHLPGRDVTPARYRVTIPAKAAFRAIRPPNLVEVRYVTAAGETILDNKNVIVRVRAGSGDVPGRKGEARYEQLPMYEGVGLIRTTGEKPLEFHFRAAKGGEVFARKLLPQEYLPVPRVVLVKGEGSPPVKLAARKEAAVEAVWYHDVGGEIWSVPSDWEPTPVRWTASGEHILVSLVPESWTDLWVQFDDGAVATVTDAGEQRLSMPGPPIEAIDPARLPAGLEPTETLAATVQLRLFYKGKHRGWRRVAEKEFQSLEAARRGWQLRLPEGFPARVILTRRGKKIHASVARYPLEPR